MFDFLNLKPETFGLDISEFSLKIIKLKKMGKSLTLSCFGETNLKPGIIEEGEVKNEKALAKSVKKAIANAKGEPLKTKYVIADLPEEKAFFDVIKMPKMTPKELKKAVYFEAENYVPLPINEVYLDFQIIHPLCDHLDHLDVLIAALPKKTVDPYVNALKIAGLTPCAMEIESQAITQCLIKNNTAPKPVLLIDIGLTRTSFIIFSGHTLRFTSSIPFSSQTFNKAICKTLKVRLIEAENLRIQHGIKDKRGKVFEVLIPCLTDLVEQIKKCVTYYQSHAKHQHLPHNTKGVAKIKLCGGVANLLGLPEFLEQELKIPVARGNPWINIPTPDNKQVLKLPPKESLRYVSALGLALHSYD